MPEYTVIYILKSLFICIFMFYTNNKILDIKECNKKKVFIFIIISLFLSLIYKYINLNMKIEINGAMYNVVVMTIVYSKFYKIKIAYSMLINMLSLAITQILFLASTLILYILANLVNIKSEYINFMLITITQWILIVFIWRLKRFKHGIAFIKNTKDDEQLNLMVFNLSSMILILVVIISNYKESMTSKFGVVLIIFSIIMFITIQKSLQLYYKHKMLVKALEETQKELNEKKEEVKKLEKENLNFSQTSHSISHRQKSIEHKLNILLANNGNINSKDIENEIKNIRKELEIETKVELKKTGIAVIDDMLSYMQAECIKNNINFQLQISGNMYHMVNNYIDKSDLEILLADHIKDAIIAVNHVETNNKSILVRIGEIDGKYGVYFYDSGVEFTIGTLIKLGKVPVTTYKEEGGSGMGFMNSFNTLNKYKATLIIEELNKPTNDNFTKVLKFIFNEEEKFKILSYRNQEIANENNNKELIIEKLQK